MLAWGAKASAQFRLRVGEIAADLGCDPSWLMAIMAFESNLNPAARNATTDATGLIQFMPATAKGLGTTTDALAAMSAEDQLEYVARYFAPYRGRLANLGDCYMAVLWPPGIGKPDDWVAFYPGSKQYLANRGLDINHDGAVTRGECVSFPAKRLAEGLLPPNAAPLVDEQPPAPIEDKSTEADAATVAAATQQEAPAMADDSTSGIEPFLSGALKVGEVALTAINPVLGGLASALINAFEPMARTTIAAAINKHTDNPQIGTQVADAVINAAKQVTGIADPTVAAANALTNDTQRAQVQAMVLANVQAMAPLFDQITQATKDEWTAVETSRQASAGRGNDDIRNRLAAYVWFAIAGMAVFLGVSIIAQIYLMADHKPLPELVVAFTGAFSYLLGRLGDVYGWAFGGVKESTVPAVITNQINKAKA